MTLQMNNSAKNLEAIFFAKHNKERLDAMRAEKQADSEREDLTRASGITEEDVLDELREVGIRPQTLAALSLVPLVQVAWADGVLDHKERVAILSAVHESGIEKGSPSYEVLESWLDQAPEDDVVNAWADYVGALSKNMEKAAFASLRRHVLDMANKVADASGGFLGLGNKTSDVEQEVLDKLTRAFE